MDIPRKSQARARLVRRVFLAVVLLTAVAGITWWTAHLEPAAPMVERAGLWIDTVKRGPMVIAVRGAGKLLPEEIHWITAAVDGRVEKKLLEPGASVEPNTVLVELSNPQLEHDMLKAEGDWRTAETNYDELRIQLEGKQLTLESAIARAESQYRISRLDHEAYELLSREGVVSEMDLLKRRETAAQQEQTLETEKRQLEINRESARAQLAVQGARVEQARALYELYQSRFAQLRVRAGVRGVLQELPVELGKRVGTGENLARVADPLRLKAEISIPETQARDIMAGQDVTIDTRNGIIPGLVARVDPAVRDGAVAVDVRLTGALPRGARPDLSVDGTIVIENLPDVIYVGRPVGGAADGALSLFKLDRDGSGAERVQVTLGRSSVNVVEVKTGLQPGDEVILSDMAEYDHVAHLRVSK